MTTQHPAHPPIVSQQEWLLARETLLAHEKELTQHYDRVNAERRRLPMVRVEKSYIFNSPEGPRSLYDLFDDQTQLIVYHFMFHPTWDNGCAGCTGFVNDLKRLVRRSGQRFRYRQNGSYSIIRGGDVRRRTAHPVGRGK